jgi:hypothetical protein
MLPEKHKFGLGQQFQSAKIGKKESFVGDVVFVGYGSHGVYVHLRDSDGNDWSRTREDLSFIESAEREQAAS